ncbi:hypothetical protein BJV77DRAFT_985805, partial [Russula vinacea]
MEEIDAPDIARPWGTWRRLPFVGDRFVSPTVWTPHISRPSPSPNIAAGDCINAAFRNDKPVSMMDLLPTRLPAEDVQHAFDQPVCGAIAPLEPGSQTPGVTVGRNGVQCYPRKVLNEVSAGTNLMATSRSAVYFAESNKAQGKRPKRGTPRADKKDLHRHLRSTKAHNARPVAYYAMRSHRAYCQGTTVETGAAQAA